MTMKNIVVKILIFVGFYILYGCNNYLDVIPDNIPTIEHAFINLTTIYS